MNLADSSLESCQTESLFLLVGRNPLPNYVAAKLLLKHSGMLYLIHSEGPQGTGGVAQRLAAHFPQHQPQQISVNPRNYDVLVQEVKRYLDQTPNGPIGLNYTGGTKIMAIYIYRAVQEFCERHDRKAIFSYLDSDTLQLAVESIPDRLISQFDTLGKVQLTLKELLDLQGIHLQTELRTDPILPDLARALANMHETPRGAAAWQACRQVLQESNDRLWTEVRTDLHNIGATPHVLDRLEQDLFGRSPTIDFYSLPGNVGLKSSRELLIWLAGAWLEHWGLVCLQALGYKECARDLVGRALLPFEIDLIALRDYQPFVLSCYAGAEHRATKLRLMEVYTRGRQIGGDDSRIGLVCTTEEPLYLEQEISYAWDVDNRIRVFGRKHLPELEIHFKSWFDNA